MSNFQDDNHALLCGIVLGHLMEHGVDVEPVLDDDGNYTFKLLLRVPDKLAPEYRLAGKQVVLAVFPYEEPVKR